MRLFAPAFVLGALMLQHESWLPGAWPAPVGVALLLGCGLVPPGRCVMRALLLLRAGVLTGYGWSAWRAEARLADALPRVLEGRDVELAGIVAGLPQLSERGTRFLFHVEKPAGVPRVVSLMWHADRTGRPGPAIVPGQRWHLTARLKRPRGFSNPHGFDFEPWALERGIRAAGYVRDKPAPRLAAASARSPTPPSSGDASPRRGSTPTPGPNRRS